MSNLPYRLVKVNGFAVPATRHDAIKKILHGVETGRITMKARGRYRHGGSETFCAIGHLLTGTQIDKIRNDRKMQASLRDVKEKFGKQNIEAMTGMTIADALTVQRAFDGAPNMDDFKRLMTRILDHNANYDNPGAKGVIAFPVSGE